MGQLVVSATPIELNRRLFAKEKRLRRGCACTGLINAGTASDRG